MPLHVVYSPGYRADIGAHVFPTAKFDLIGQHLLETAGGRLTFVDPTPAAWVDLATVHAPEYLARLRGGTLSWSELAQLELPWSPEIVEGFRLMTGGTIQASRLALVHGLSVQIGGGFHHAFPDHGEGFCMFNDVAVAIRVLQREARIRRCAVVDCDVHHGNGTAAIFGTDPDVFTLSMHQWHNYPAVKPPSTLDLHLPDGIGDTEYLRRLDEALPHVVDFEPELALYLAGADPYEDDQLGGLSLTREGLRERDRRVLRALRGAGIPVAVTLAGGYARRLDDTVNIHLGTIEEAVEVADSNARG